MVYDSRSTLIHLDPRKKTWPGPFGEGEDLLLEYAEIIQWVFEELKITYFEKMSWVGA